MSFSKKRYLTEVNQKLEQYFFESKNNHNNRDIISEQSSPLLYRSCGKLGIYSYGCVDVKPEEKNIIKQVQKCLGITKADGYFGPKTLEALESKFPNTEGVFTVADFKTICGKEWVGSQTSSGGATAGGATAGGATAGGATAGSTTPQGGMSFPIIEKGSYITKGNIGVPECDELHAFQSTKGTVVGDVHVTVSDKLEEIYFKGYNPKPTDVKVSVTKSGNRFKVDWSVTIDESKDGKAWVKFSSRGAGCGGPSKGQTEQQLQARAGSQLPALETNIKAQYGNDSGEYQIEKVKQIFNTEGGDGFWFVQDFYTYTLPISFQPHQKTQVGSQTDQKTQPASTTNSTTNTQDPNYRTRKDVDYSETPVQPETPAKPKDLNIRTRKDVIGGDENV